MLPGITNKMVASTLGVKNYFPKLNIPKIGVFVLILMLFYGCNSGDTFADIANKRKAYAFTRKILLRNQFEGRNVIFPSYESDDVKIDIVGENLYRIKVKVKENKDFFRIDISARDYGDSWAFETIKVSKN